jgi:hypothetical protein
MPGRRAFMKTAGLLALGASAGGHAEMKKGRDWYELRRYRLENDAQRTALEKFLGEAAMPAWNRAGITSAGAFIHAEKETPVFVLLRHEDPAVLLDASGILLADAACREKGAAFLDAPASDPAYARMETSVMFAFEGMPRLEIPVKNVGRVFQLRTYESPSLKTGLKKIEMFNTGEIAIFRKTGLTPVFFGQTLAGAQMPNLTYMLGFESMDAQKAAWDTFRADPAWKVLSARPEYANDAILRGITNIPLKPLACSQI